MDVLDYGLEHALLNWISNIQLREYFLHLERKVSARAVLRKTTPLYSKHVLYDMNYV